MSHELDEMAPGVYAAAFARQDAWHQLGTTVPDRDMDASDVLELAHLGGWNVRKLDLTATEMDENGVTTLDVPDRFATVRTNPVTGKVEYLGTVGSYYTPIQNEEHVDLLNALVGEGGMHFDTAGSLRRGRTTFVTMKKPEHLLIGGKDEVALNLIALNSFDGTSKFRFMVSPVRVVCANTESAAIRSARSTFGIRHTTGASSHIQEAREALKLTFKYVDAFQTAADAMIEQTVTKAKFEKIVAGLFDVDAATTDRSRDQRLARVADVVDLRRTSDTLDGIRGSAWGAYNAVTEYVDHIMPVNGGGDLASKRATRALTMKSINALKLDAFRALAPAGI